MKPDINISCQSRSLLGATVVGLAIVVLSGSLSFAQQPVTGTGDWYYRIGGAAPISPAPNVRATPIVIDAGAALQLPKACGALDPVISINNFMNEVKDGVEQVEDTMILAAQSAIAALPAIVLQRLNPGLYEHFQNAIANAKLVVDLSVKSCREMVDDAANGDNPFQEWVRVSKRFTWGTQLDEPGNDPVSARKAVEETNGDDGVPWLGGSAGGAGQEPIRIVYDTTRAGYNVTLNREPDATGAPSPPPAGEAVPRLVQLWGIPEEAAEWAVQVLGDTQIQTCQGCTQAGQPGLGFTLKYDAERDTIAPLLVDLVNGVIDPTIENLSEVSAASVRVTPKLIEALQGIRDSQEQALAIDRLAADIAAARTVEKALSVRQMLLTGQRVPTISSSKRALQKHEVVLGTIETEIDRFLYESRIHRELVSNTAQVILERAAVQGMESVAEPPSSPNDPDAVMDGRVPTE